jgi:hypothetical protein
MEDTNAEGESARERGRERQGEKERDRVERVKNNVSD